MKGLIPNALTMGNLICGALAVIFILRGDVMVAPYLMLLGALFDFGDGLAARLLGVSGPLGKQLDSLADVITFGLLPALMACTLIDGFGESYFAYFPLIIVVASVYRLARFNIDENQSDGFIGLPTPANALFWASLLVISNSSGNALVDFLSGRLESIPFVVFLSVLMSWLLISPIPLVAMKFKKGQRRRNSQRLILAGLSAMIVLVIYLMTKNAWVAVPFILLLYLIYSIIIHSIARNEIQS